MIAALPRVLDGALDSPTGAVMLGLALAGLVALGWLLLVQRAGVDIWRAVMRVGARTVGGTIALLLLPEYAVTTRRRSRGVAPPRAALLMSRVAEPLLNAALTVHERNPPRKIVWRRFPWKLCAFALAASLATWSLLSYLEKRYLEGSTSGDRITGTADADRITGQAGHDRLDGRGGDDTIFGGPGNDTLIGGSGDDRLSDAHGRDLYFGGAGNDRVNARDATAGGRARVDRVFCGPGYDLAIIDRRDRASGCERIDRAR